MATQLDAAQALRHRAESAARARMNTHYGGAQNQTVEDLQSLVHELRVHQIELEMQNDELRQTQLQLDTARARYFDLYDLAPVGYCTVSAQGHILEANFTAVALLGLVRSDFVHQKFNRFIAPSSQDIYHRCHAVLFEDRTPQECELQMVKTGGQLFWVHLRNSLAEDANGAQVQRMVLSDIDERKRLDKTLQEKVQELEAARSVADQANLAKSDFLSSMSHELRSPLNAILGFAQLMEMGDPLPSPAQKFSIDQILRSGWYLLELVTEILDFNSTASGQLALTLQSVLLHEVLRDCQALVQAGSDKRRIHLQLPVVDEDLAVWADRARLQQVIVHLLSNAIQYNRLGGVVELSCRLQTPQRLRIGVRDTGEGLSSAKMDQLFHPFNPRSLDATGLEGTGIGLALSKRLVELMGGTLQVESTLGLGTEFWVELNVQAPFVR